MRIRHSDARIDSVMSVRFADLSCDFLSLMDSLCLPRYRLAANSISKRVIGRVCLALHLRIACLSIQRLISGLNIRSFCRLLTARDYLDIAIGCTLSTWRKQFLIEDILATSLCARSTDCSNFDNVFSWHRYHVAQYRTLIILLSTSAFNYVLTANILPRKKIDGRSNALKSVKGYL